MNRPDAWNPLREFTDARIALGRSGASLPTREVLNFGLAHARARDAIHQPFASQQLVAPLAALGLDALTVHSAAPDRHTYLRRPDLGRQLADESRADLAASGVRPADLLLVIGDGLSSWAVEPGLSSPDSLGVYLTWQPHRQRLESERNCISNIRPEGLSHDAAAFKLAWLLEQAFLRRLTGVGLKDESDNPALHGKIKPLPPLK
ncbi:MAG: ethanolamine ammonia-lyase subunit EutC [Klebsiella pneumoniae]|nr:ethanolamine ammonia-lyase subunit EutC [Klebsiella pneumoniae]